MDQSIEEEDYLNESDDRDYEVTGNNSFYSVNIPITIPDTQLKTINNLPLKYRDIFHRYPNFNHVQSMVFDKVVYSNESIVVAAPTGSGKTTILELAVVNILMNNNVDNNLKIIYMAPLKALCNEKYNDWCTKYSKYNLNCIELTGDTDLSEDYNLIRNANIICTTPEKWDAVTRMSRDRKFLINSIKLFLIDEIHVLGENNRGSIIEVVVSRMKTYAYDNSNAIRFIAVSATIPNINDIADWLTIGANSRANIYNIDDSYRPVKINKLVFTYPSSKQMSSFCFDLKLNYKLADLVQTYSNNKPTLIFCSTRKSTQQAASIMTKSNYFSRFSQENNQQRREAMLRVRDQKIRELLQFSIGFHHAGLSSEDRKIIENLFLNGHLRVLLCTSTLSIGVNLPAHLVIIKSTEYYSNQSFNEYSITQITQMIGRAGRPQFDKTATAIIMTKEQNRSKYQSIVQGSHNIESNLHQNLIEYLNNEIVLRTINSIEMAIKWLKSTYFYIRLKKNPKYYGANINSNQQQIEKFLEDLCTRAINALIQINLIRFSNDGTIIPTSEGFLMYKYFISYDTMKKFIQNFNSTDEIKSDIFDLLELIASSKEFDDIKLRNSEKAVLNELNKSKNKKTIRYRLNGKIKTSQMKINVLIQAQFDLLQIADVSLQQDAYKIFKYANKLSKCLMEYVYKQSVEKPANKYELCLNTIFLNKCVLSKLWHDTPHIFKQLQRIGATTSQAFVDAHYITFEQVEALNSFEIESLVNRHPPFGCDILTIVRSLPRFEIYLNDDTFESDGENDAQINVHISIKLLNNNEINDSDGGYLGKNHQFIIIIGDNLNNIIHLVKVNIDYFMTNNGIWRKMFCIDKNTNGNKMKASIISVDFIGLDAHSTFHLFDSEQEIIEEPQKMAKKRKTGPEANKEANSSKKPRNEAKKSDQQTKTKATKVVNDVLSNHLNNIRKYEFKKPKENNFKYASKNQTASVMISNESAKGGIPYYFKTNKNVAASEEAVNFNLKADLNTLFSNTNQAFEQTVPILCNKPTVTTNINSENANKSINKVPSIVNNKPQKLENSNETNKNDKNIKLLQLFELDLLN